MCLAGELCPSSQLIRVEPHLIMSVWRTPSAPICNACHCRSTLQQRQWKLEAVTEQIRRG